MNCITIAIKTSNQISNPVNIITVGLIPNALSFPLYRLLALHRFLLTFSDRNIMEQAHDSVENKTKRKWESKKHKMLLLFHLNDIEKVHCG